MTETQTFTKESLEEFFNGKEFRKIVFDVGAHMRFAHSEEEITKVVHDLATDIMKCLEQ